MSNQVAAQTLTGYFCPDSVADALDTARRLERDYAFVAGGTDIMPLKQQGLVSSNALIDLSGISELRTLHSDANGLEIGSLVTLENLARATVIRRDYPILDAAAESIASPVLRKTATVGGNLLVDNRCTFYNQSQFWRDSVGSCLKDSGDKCLVTGVVGGKCFARGVSDLLPALIALSAQVEIRDLDGQRTEPLEELFAQDGICRTPKLRPESILLKLRILSPAKSWYFRKLRLRRSVDFASLTVAAVRDHTDNLRVCLNGIAMAPVLITGASSELTLDYLVYQARLKSKAVENDLLALEYRKSMMTVFLGELWDVLCPK